MRNCRASGVSLVSVSHSTVVIPHICRFSRSLDVDGDRRHNRCTMGHTPRDGIPRRTRWSCCRANEVFCGGHLSPCTVHDDIHIPEPFGALESSPFDEVETQQVTRKKKDERAECATESYWLAKYFKENIALELGCLHSSHTRT